MQQLYLFSKNIELILLFVVFENRRMNAFLLHVDSASGGFGSTSVDRKVSLYAEIEIR